MAKNRLNFKIVYRRSADETDDQVSTVEIQSFPFLIGKLPSNNLILEDEAVEPIHAIIEEEDGKITITDLDSESGVRLNGKPIEVIADLEVGQTFEIGSYEMTLDEVVEHVLPPPPVLPGQPADQIPPPPPPPRVGKNFSPDNNTKSLSNQIPVDRSHEKSATEAPQSSKGAAAFIDDQETQTSDVHKDESHQQEVGATVGSAALKKADDIQLKSGMALIDDESRYQVPSVDPKDKRVLFNPKKAKPSGQVLETVAYWNDVILDVNFFHPNLKGFEYVTIGDSKEAHFMAASDENLSLKRIAKVGTTGFRLRLLPGMTAKVRQSGQVEKIEGPAKIKLGRRDLAHIKYGPINYFMVFIRPPKLEISQTRRKDPIMVLLGTIFTAIFLFLSGVFVFTDPKPVETLEEDIYSIVHIPSIEEQPKPIEQPKVEKPQVELSEVKEVPKKVEPPKPKPIKPAPPKEVPKPKQTKPVERPQEQAQKPASTALKPQPKRPQPEKKSGQGMASTGAKKPDFKKAGPNTRNPSPRSGGARGSGKSQQGAPRKGKSAVSAMGAEGANNNKPSGVNLGKLGLGAGKVSSLSGVGAISSDFKSSAGGAGGGSGSASRNLGFGGGIGNSSSLGLAGSGSAVNNFGSGSGGLGSGEGGTGGLGGAGIGRGFGSGGRGRANVDIPAEGPVVSQGLSRQEILAVIKVNLNQIRHCYERLLQRSPSASGKVTVDFSIGSTGRVISARIASGNISDSMMRGCITGRVQRWKFPAPRGGAQKVDVTYPFVFSPL